MGQANRAPRSSYKRRFFIGNAALASTRKLVKGLESRSDEDIANLIDESVGLAYDAGKRRIFDFEGELQDAVDLEHSVFAGESLIAVVAKNKLPASVYELAIVSVAPKTRLLTIDKTVHVGAGVMAAQLAAAAPIVRKPTEPSTAVTATGPIPASERTPMTGPPIETWLICYRDTTGEQQFDRVAGKDAQSYVAALIDKGVHPTGIEVFRPVAKRTKVVVEFE